MCLLLQCQNLFFLLWTARFKFPPKIKKQTFVCRQYLGKYAVQFEQVFIIVLILKQEIKSHDSKLKIYKSLFSEGKNSHPCQPSSFPPRHQMLPIIFSSLSSLSFLFLPIKKWKYPVNTVVNLVYSMSWLLFHIRIKGDSKMSYLMTIKCIYHQFNLSPLCWTVQIVSSLLLIEIMQQCHFAHL